MSHLDATERASIKIAAMLRPTLLFPADSMFMSSTLEVLQRIMDAPSLFKQTNGLTVGAKKKKWMIGGSVLKSDINHYPVPPGLTP